MTVPFPNPRERFVWTPNMGRASGPFFYRPQRIRGTQPWQRRCLFGLTKEAVMGFGRGALLWLLGVPLPIIILLALFWHH